MFCCEFQYGFSIRIKTFAGTPSETCEQKIIVSESVVLGKSAKHRNVGYFSIFVVYGACTIVLDNTEIAAMVYFAIAGQYHVAVFVEQSVV